MSKDVALWPSLRQHTAARIGLARTGASLATAPLLDFRLAHAQARDAVHTALDEPALLAQLPPPVLVVASQAPDRATYLRRPDLGRRLDPAATAILAPHAGTYDLVIAISDGLSATAAQRHAAPLLQALLPALATWSLAPIVLIHGARVATADQAALILLGERPGLSAPDSLGAYLTWNPTPTTSDADRNCISNIRLEGLTYREAAHRLHHLLDRMRALRHTGVALKDESDRSAALGPPS
jgi:ethanolamine ammonia-lyase small subunit